MSEHDLTQDPLQDIPDINYNKKELATPFLVNDILEEPQSQAYSSSGPGLTQRGMNCATPPSPPSPNLLYSGYPRSSGSGPPTTVSMASFSPSMSSPAGVAPTPYPLQV